MLTSAKITSNFKNWYRLYCKEDKELIITFEAGVNVIASPNGKGKTTFAKAIESYVLNQENQDSISLSGEFSPERPNMFFFAMKDLNPEFMLHKVNPMSDIAGTEAAFWLERGYLSHGQSTDELAKDIEEMINNGTAGCIIIDEPELALDASNMVKLINMFNRVKDKAQIIVISHHPWLVMNRDFNLINFDPSVDYRKEMESQQKKLNLSGV